MITQQHLLNFEMIKEFSDLQTTKTFYILTPEQIKRYYEIKNNLRNR